MTEEIYNIIVKIGCERHHVNGVECTKKEDGNGKWIGSCGSCEQLHCLWANDEANRARRFAVVERHVYSCTEGTVKFGKVLAGIIGDRTGTFKVVKKMIPSRNEQFVYYFDSHFLEDSHV